MNLVEKLNLPDYYKFLQQHLGLVVLWNHGMANK